MIKNVDNFLIKSPKDRKIFYNLTTHFLTPPQILKPFSIRYNYKKLNNYLKLSRSPLKFKISDQLITVDLAVDYLVEHKGVKYLAEVKSGKSAGRIQHKDTRRQLIEYHVINPFDGLLLVDMEYKTIQQVEF